MFQLSSTLSWLSVVILFVYLAAFVEVVVAPRPPVTVLPPPTELSELDEVAALIRTKQQDVDDAPFDVSAWSSAERKAVKLDGAGKSAEGDNLGQEYTTRRQGFRDSVTGESFWSRTAPGDVVNNLEDRQTGKLRLFGYQLYSSCFV